MLGRCAQPCSDDTMTSSQVAEVNSTALESAVAGSSCYVAALHRIGLLWTPATPTFRRTWDFSTDTTDIKGLHLSEGSTDWVRV
jgi:hypothetical protein